MASWLSYEEARQFWRDAPADDDVLAMYLDAAREAVIAYAPPVEGVPADDGYGYGDGPYGGDVIPNSWRLAQWMQARNTFNSGKAAPGGDMDGSGYGITAHPLDWQVKQILRPQRGVGAMA